MKITREQLKQIVKEEIMEKWSEAGTAQARRLTDIILHELDGIVLTESAAEKVIFLLRKVMAIVAE